MGGVIDCLGMQPCENSAQSQPKAKVHNLYLSGTFGGNCKVLARCQVSLASSGDGTILKVRPISLLPSPLLRIDFRALTQVAVRSENPEVSQMMSECIR